ncbi:hypothetical protein [Rheinheimera sp. WS51]|uniref:hypothetical protein n=1 Tax=Rheinheimera sp. WS51 TaxID=3425886 RepID=UPI003D90DC8F
MAKLNEYIGGIISSITNARVMADIQTVKVAEEYAKHDLLKHFAVPRMRVSDVELTIPVAMDTLSEKMETEFQPIDNTKFNSLVYRELTNGLGRTSLPVEASKDLRSQIARYSQTLEQSLRINQNLSSVKEFSHQTVDYLFHLAEKHNLIKKSPKFNPEQMMERLIKVAEQEIKVVSQKNVLENLNVIAESHKLREEKPESLIYIKLKITEDGMEWQQSENAHGDISRNLLPE